MTNALRRKNDVLMEGVQSDIQELKQGQKETNQLLSAHIESEVQSRAETQKLLKKHDVILVGDPELGVKGHREEIRELRRDIQPILTILSNAKLLWGMFGVIGISTVKDLFEIISPAIRIFIEKVLAR